MNNLDLTDVEILKIFNEHFAEYLRNSNPFISDKELKKEIIIFNSIYYSLIRDTPYFIITKNKLYIIYQAKTFFKDLKKYDQVLDTVNVVKNLLLTFYKTQPSIKNKKTIIFLQYCPLILGCATVIQMSFNILIVYIA